MYTSYCTWQILFDTLGHSGHTLRSLSKMPMGGSLTYSKVQGIPRNRFNTIFIMIELLATVEYSIINLFIMMQIIKAFLDRQQMCTVADQDPHLDHCKATGQFVKNMLCDGHRLVELF